MKNTTKIILLLVLSIFLVGMLASSATASHTFKKGGYKVTVSDSDYNKIKKGKLYIDKQVGSKIVKIPKYKTVKKKVWIYKQVTTFKTVYSSDFSDCTYYDYDYKHNQYVNKGWTYYGYKITKSSNGRVVKTIDKFKKKVTKNVKVKNGYKTVKKPVYFHIGEYYDFGEEKHTGKIYTIVDNSKYCVF